VSSSSAASHRGLAYVGAALGRLRLSAPQQLGDHTALEYIEVKSQKSVSVQGSVVQCVRIDWMRCWSLVQCVCVSGIICLRGLRVNSISHIPPNSYEMYMPSVRHPRRMK
jgi:hypothetical protein